MRKELGWSTFGVTRPLAYRTHKLRRLARALSTASGSAMKRFRQHPVIHVIELDPAGSAVDCVTPWLNIREWFMSSFSNHFPSPWLLSPLSSPSGAGPSASAVASARALYLINLLIIIIISSLHRHRIGVSELVIIPLCPITTHNLCSLQV